MSEYQYYEFQAIDRPLSVEQQAAMCKLSSQVDLSATRAAFNYSYSNFRGDPMKVLEQHFDALLYIASWGSKQLAFRFPREAITAERLEPYLLGDEESYVDDLQVVAQHQGQQAAFDARLWEVIAPYTGSSALQRRLKAKQLV